MHDLDIMTTDKILELLNEGTGAFVVINNHEDTTHKDVKLSKSMAVFLAQNVPEMAYIEGSSIMFGD